MIGGTRQAYGTCRYPSVVAKPIPPFTAGTIESIAHAVGELYSGSELTRLLADKRLPDPLGEGQTKWRRLAAAMIAQQNRQGDGRPVVALITAAMAPDRTLSRRSEATIVRDALNQVLSLSGYRVLDDGRVGTTTRTTTDIEAASRSVRLHTGLADRGAHDEVLRYCRAELLRTDFYEAVFEAIKGLGARLRMLAGVDQDGRALVQATLRGQSPIVRITECRAVTQRNEQEGVALLAEGLFAAFRNPISHETQVAWSMLEQDALDVLGVLSLVHRRLDNATIDRPS